MLWMAEASRADVIPHSSSADGPNDSSLEKRCPVEAIPLSYGKVQTQNHQPMKRIHLRSEYAMWWYFVDMLCTSVCALYHFSLLYAALILIVYQGSMLFVCFLTLWLYAFLYDIWLCVHVWYIQDSCISAYTTSRDPSISDLLLCLHESVGSSMLLPSLQLPVWHPHRFQTFSLEQSEI